MTKRFLTPIDLGGNNINAVATATLATQAINLGQMQSYVAGVVHYVEARAASTTNVTLTAPGAAIDGVTLVANDRVLLKNQTNQFENGVYVWTASGSTLTRATDSNTSSLLAGQVVTLTEGTVNADKAFIQSTVGTITVGTTNLVYAAFNAGATYTGTNGVTISGTNVQGVVLASGGLLVGASGFYLDSSIAVRKYAISIGNASSTTFAVTHSLGTRDVQVQVYDNATYDTVEVDVVRTDTNNVQITFTGTTPASNAYRVVVQG